MAKSFKRPRTKKELDQLEVRGLWRAIAQSRRFAENHTRITIEIILSVHKTIFENAFPEIAGRFRVDGEDVKKLKYHEPPPGRVVSKKIQEYWQEFDHRISLLSQINKVVYKDEEGEKWVLAVFEFATWAQHQITSIHPFCDGNGRMARLMTNMILIWFGLPPSPLKFEGENKDSYLQGLCQIDKYNDYEPLKNILLQGSFETLQKEERARMNADQSKN